DPAAAVRADADFGIAGRTEAWALVGTAALERGAQAADIEIRGRGDPAGMRLQTLRASMPGGRLDGSGEVTWAPTLGWTLDATLAGFDPGYFVPDFNGAIDGRIASTGTTRDDGGLDVTVDALGIGGQLRGR